jgi:hypothetical protein
MLPYTISGKTDIKLPLENAGINKENNCKPDHNRSELLCHWLVKDKYVVKIFFNMYLK